MDSDATVLHKLQAVASLVEDPNVSVRVLRAWASELAKQNLKMSIPIEYVEAPLRRVTTDRVFYHTARYLTTIASARFYVAHPELCWGQWTPAWWQERGKEAKGALAALQDALQGSQGSDEGTKAWLQSRLV